MKQSLKDWGKAMAGMLALWLIFIVFFTMLIAPPQVYKAITDQLADTNTYYTNAIGTLESSNTWLRSAQTNEFNIKPRFSEQQMSKSFWVEYTNLSGAVISMYGVPFESLQVNHDV